MNIFCNCASCKYWSHKKDDFYGQCRKRAPVVAFGLEQPPDEDHVWAVRTVTVWPETRERDGCAEGVPR